MITNEMATIVRENYRTSVLAAVKPHWRRGMFCGPIWVCAWMLLFLAFIGFNRTEAGKKYQRQHLSGHGGGFLALTGMIALFAGPLWLNKARVRRREMLQFLAQAQPVLAPVLIANSTLTRASYRSAPALVLVTFATAEAMPWERMLALVEKMDELANSGGDSPEARFCAGLLGDETYHPQHRVRLPDSLTGGIPVYACYLMVNPRYLAQEPAELPVFLCMAEPGESGRIEHVPAEHARDCEFIQMLSKEDGRLELVRQLAQADLPRFTQLFHEERDGHYFAVKVPLTEAGITEHAWVTVQKIEGQTITGTIDNILVHLKQLKEGDVVTSTLAQVEDCVVVEKSSQKIVLGGHHQTVMQKEGKTAP